MGRIEDRKLPDMRELDAPQPAKLGEDKGLSIEHVCIRIVVSIRYKVYDELITPSDNGSD